MTHRRLVSTLVVLATAAMGTAAPAAIGTAAPPTLPGNYQAVAVSEYAQCRRDNGIEDYPDPQVGDDGGLMIQSPLDLNTHTDEEVAEAQEACLPILEAAEPAQPAGSAPTAAPPN